MPIRRKIRVLAATQNEQVYRQLQSRDDVEFDIALYTGAVESLLGDVQLLILDDEDLVTHPLSRVELREALGRTGIRYCSGDDFLNDPQRFFGEFVTNRAGQMLVFPETYCIAFIACSGGTGCTTLAMDTALHYAKARAEAPLPTSEDGTPRFRSRAALFEVVYGTSAFMSLTGVEMPQLYKLATDSDVKPLEFKGVDMYPMDHENVRVLTTEHIGNYFRRQVLGHGLTVIDSVWPHEQLSAIQQHVNLWVVVATDRKDTEENARHLRDALVDLMQQPLDPTQDTTPRMGETEARERVWMLHNQVDPKHNSQGDTEFRLVVPRISAADDLRGAMGQVVLKGVFDPLWEEESSSRSSGFFGS